MELFHVDRSRQLESGRLCSLQLLKIDIPHLEAHLSDLFPEGVSSHGRQYFANAKAAPSENKNVMLELVFEFVRRAAFPHWLSRFQSMFAFASVDDARRMNVMQGYPVFQLEGEGAGRFDMNWLVAASSLDLSWRAHQYWSQEPTEEPLWEVLMPLPVTVGSLVCQEL